MNSLLAPPGGPAAPRAPRAQPGANYRTASQVSQATKCLVTMTVPREIQQGLHRTQVSRSNGGLGGVFNGGIIYKAGGKLGEKAGAADSREWGARTVQSSETGRRQGGPERWQLYRDQAGEGNAATSLSPPSHLQPVLPAPPHPRPLPRWPGSAGSQRTRGPAVQPIKAASRDRLGETCRMSSQRPRERGERGHRARATDQAGPPLPCELTRDRTYCPVPDRTCVENSHFLKFS